MSGGEEHGLTASLIEELRGEVQHMRKILAKAVERLAYHSGDEIEKAIFAGFEAIDAADKVLQVISPGALSENPLHPNLTL